VTGTYQAIVLGLGAMGAATVYQLARRGITVLGIDRFSPPHHLGSSHGDTRITRKAIGEGGEYTPISLRSYEIFADLERQSGRSLLTMTGGLVISSNATSNFNHVANFFNNTVGVAQRFGIRHEILEAAEMRRRFPPLKVADDELGYYEHDAGFLRPELCIATQLELAAESGADLHTGETVVSFSDVKGGVRVVTSASEYRAANLVVTAGPWLPELLSDEWRPFFKIYRQVLYWFAVEGAYETLAPGNFPVFIWEVQGEACPMYGFPAVDGPAGGMKIGREEYSQTTSPEAVDRTVSQAEIAHMHDTQVAPFFHGVESRCLRSAVCLYTLAPEAAFVIDRLPGSPSVIIASPCSGHGFKHSAAVGEALAELVVAGASRLDLSAFSFDALRARHG